LVEKKNKCGSNKDPKKKSASWVNGENSQKAAGNLKKKKDEVD